MRRRRAAALVGTLGLLFALVPSAVAGAPADVCLEVDPAAVSAEEWSAVAAPVSEAIAQRTALFPAPEITTEGTRLDIASGHAGLSSGSGSCLEAGAGWTSRFDHRFLQAGAELLLAQAPTTPGIDSDVSIEWFPHEARLRTTLVFAGPLDIPNGTCWVDDALAVDEGVVQASGDEGLETSLFAEGACGRFFDHLPEGGAGEQAVTLLPTMIELPDGGRLRFVAEEVSVRDDALVVSGSLARD